MVDIIERLQGVDDLPVGFVFLQHLIADGDRDRIDGKPAANIGGILFDLVDGDHVRIWVRDTGKGIAEADQYRIFDRFVKVDEYIPGTGLGLSVAKAHVESLGGKMGVDSKLGSGSIFWIELPLA